MLAFLSTSHMLDKNADTSLRVLQRYARHDTSARHLSEAAFYVCEPGAATWYLPVHH